MNLTLVCYLLCHQIFVGGTSVFVGLQENLRWSTSTRRVVVEGREGIVPVNLEE